MQYSRILLFIHSKCNSLHLPTPTEKAMATHSSTLAWKIPWAEEPGRLQSDTTERLHFHFPFPLSCIGEGNGNPIQCSCLENPRDGGAWRAAVYGVAQSWIRLKRLSSKMSELCCSLNILWHCPSLGLERKLTFSSPCGHCWVTSLTPP